MKKIRVVSMRPGEMPDVTEIAPNLEAMQAMVEGYIECVPLLIDGKEFDLWCNEEGKINGLKPTFVHDGIYDIICGPLFVAKNDGEGATKGLTKAEALKVKAALYEGRAE